MSMKIYEEEQERSRGGALEEHRGRRRDVKGGVQERSMGTFHEHWSSIAPMLQGKGENQGREDRPKI